MRNLAAILHDLRADSGMEFAEELVGVQAILNTFNECIKPLRKIQYQGGNELFLHEIVQRLMQLLKRRGFLSVDALPQKQYTAELRRITLYLILNTEITHKYPLAEDTVVGHLANTLPVLPKCVLLYCVWGLSLRAFFCEALSYTPLWFATQLLDETVTSLKSAKPYDCIDRVEEIVVAIYLAVCRSDLRKASDSGEQKTLLRKCADTLMELLRQFMTPDSEKHGDWSKVEFRRYLGFSIRQTARALLRCIELYQRKPVVEVESHLKYYALTTNKEPDIVARACEEYSLEVDECLTRINTVFFECIQTNVRSVTVEAYAEWVEVDLDENDGADDPYAPETLQQAVGELLFGLIARSQQDNRLKHDVIAQLGAIAIAPKSLAEKLSAATIGEILLKLDNLASGHKDRVAWMTELFARGHLVFANDECLETIEEHIEDLTVDHLDALADCLDEMRKQTDRDESVEHKIRDIVLAKLEKIPLADVKSFIFVLIDRQTMATDTLATPATCQNLTELLNKSLGGRIENLRPWMLLLAQRPQHFFDQLLEVAVKNDSQLTSVVHLMSELREISAVYLEANDGTAAMLRINVAAMESSEVDRLSNFWAQLAVSKITPLDKFVRLLLVAMDTALDDDELPKVRCILQTLQLIQRKQSLPDVMVYAQVLVAVGHVLDTCRWDLVRYTGELETVVSLSIDVISALLKRYLTMACDKDRQWIIGSTKRWKPLTRYYFQRVALPKTECPKHFVEFLCADSFAGADKSVCIAFLCENIIRCTAKEVKWIAKNNELLPHFVDTMTVLIKIQSNLPNAIHCLKNTLINFIVVLRDTIIPSKSTGDERLCLMKDVLKLGGKFPESIADELMLNLSRPLSEAIGDVNTPEQLTEIKALLDAVKDCPGKVLISEKLV